VLVLAFSGKSPQATSGIILSGVTLAALYFLIASGVSLIFGLMDVLNFAHGSLFMFGAYTGWTFYTPLSTVYSNSAVAPAVVGIFITGFSSILTGLNFLVTIHTMRAPGMTWFRLPLFVWAHYATSVVMILGTPVVAITLGLAAMERLFGLGFFNPAMGGDPILFQHLFWFYSHPAVYIMILPAMGVISELITCFSRKKIFGYGFIAMSSVSIAALDSTGWFSTTVTRAADRSGQMYSPCTFRTSVRSSRLLRMFPPAEPSGRLRERHRPRRCGQDHRRG
jgi:cytochrome c oxidase subunit 1